MDQIVLREAVDEDAPLLAGVIREAFEDHRGRLDPVSSAHGETAETVRQKLQIGRGVLALAENDVAGCVFYKQIDGYLNLGRLAVLRPYRQRGIGSRLVEYVEQRSRELGLFRVRLGVRIPLAETQAYYERRGYAWVGSGTHAGSPEPTYVILEKAIV